MGVIELAPLLEPVSADQPSGESLEYSADFIRMEQAAEGKPEQQYGETIIAAEPPDWREVRDAALSVAAQSKDLRAAVQLTRALTEQAGFAGLLDGLQLIRGYVEDFWDSVHPQLDPDDDLDPTSRFNALAALAHPTTMLQTVRRAPLAGSAAGRVALRDIAVARTASAAAEGDSAAAPAVTLDTVRAAFAESGPEEVQARTEEVSGCVAALSAIDDALSTHAGAATSPDLSPLSRVLAEASKALAEFAPAGDGTFDLDALGLGDGGLGDGGLDLDAFGAESDAIDGATGGTPARAARGASPGAIASTDDVVRALDAICAYYQAHEPSSPVPLLLGRAKRLVSKNFLEILRDLAPDGVTQAELIGGVRATDT